MAALHSDYQFWRTCNPFYIKWMAKGLPRLLSGRALVYVRYDDRDCKYRYPFAQGSDPAFSTPASNNLVVGSSWQ